MALAYGYAAFRSGVKDDKSITCGTQWF